MSNVLRLAITIGLIALSVTSPAAQQTPPDLRQAFRSAADVVTIQASVRDAADAS